MDNVPDDIAETYDLEKLEQLRALADDLRLRILDHLTHEPLTVTQLGERLGIAPAKAHYHVRELERVDLVRLVATRENRGILEKYYRTVARHLRVPDALVHRIPADEMIATTSQLLDYLTHGYLAALARSLREGDEASGSQLLTATIWTTDEEVKELTLRVDELLKAYGGPRGIPGERERMFAQLSYQLPPAVDDGAAEESVAALEQSALHGAETAPRRQRAFAAGVLHYSRADLERRLAQGYQLDINALGAVIFADDVTPELAERAIGRFRLKGKLTAPSGVREVLERKQKEE